MKGGTVTKKVLGKKEERDVEKRARAAELKAFADQTRDAIVNISNAMDALDNSAVRRKLLVLLIADLSGENRTTVNKVLDCIAELKTVYLK